MSLTIGSIIDAGVRVNPHGAAATLGEQLISFAELDAAANRCARVLVDLGVRPGDIVAWWSGSSLRTLAGFIGCARAGAVFAPLNPGLTPGEATDVLAYLQPALLVGDPEHAELAAQVAPGLPLAAFGGAGHGAADLDQLCAGADPSPLALVVSDTDPHIVYLTSGSTGRPKGALVSHRASWLRAAPGGGTFTTGLRGPGGVVSGFPLYHYGGWHYVLEAWQNRRPIHLVRRAVAEELLAAVQRWQACAMYLIPAVWERVLASDQPADLSSLRHADTGTSHTPAALLEAIKRRLPHTTTTVLYGSTEGGRMASLQDWEIAQRPGSVGRAAFPGALWLEEGEVCFASPAMMAGYLRLPEETAAALRGGVYRSGDVGELDADGYLYLTGRTRELIRTGGESVWPVEVEDALRGATGSYDVDGVHDLAIIGIPDERWGEVVCLVVTTADGAVLPEPGTLLTGVQARLAGRLASHKHPRRVVQVAAIPRTPATGQVQRRLLSQSIGSA
jgi:fatty-acyl-CoA synthase